MEAYYVLIALSLAAAIQCSPAPSNDTVKVKGQKDENVSGYFIPVDTWNSIQNQLQPKTSQPLNVNTPESSVNIHVNSNENTPVSSNPVVLPSQPASNPQPIVLPPGQVILQEDPKTGQLVLLPSNTIQSNQPQNKPTDLVQQLVLNKPVPQQVVPQQQNQPIYLQPGQSYVIQNGQNLKPSPGNVAVSSYNQGGYNNPQPSQNQGSVYTLVVNGQAQSHNQGYVYPNQNTNAYPSQTVNTYPSQNGNPYPSQNGNIYLVPVQSGSSSPIVLSPVNKSTDNKIVNRYL